MPDFKKLPKEKQGNEALRMHCAFALAQMKLSTIFYALQLKPGDDFPPNYVIKLYGTVEDASDLAYQWTALLIMGQMSGRKGFSIKNIEVINSNDIMGRKKEKGFFDPKSQYSTKFLSSDFSSFKSSSLYEKVFKPLIDPNEVFYVEAERYKPFGFHICNEELKIQVGLHMVEYLRQIYFAQVGDQPWLQYKAASKGMTDGLHQMGFVKIAFLLGNLNRKRVTKLSLSAMRMGEFGEEGVSLILSRCEGVHDIVLDDNGLNRLDPTGKDNHALLCAALSNIPPGVKVVTLRNNGLSSFNKTELMELMQAIPSTVTEVIIESNKLGPELERELLSSRSQETKPLQKPTQSVKNQQPKIEKPKEESSVKVSSVSQTHFVSKQAKTSSSSSVLTDEATMSSAFAKKQ